MAVDGTLYLHLGRWLMLHHDIQARVGREKMIHWSLFRRKAMQSDAPRRSCESSSTGLPFQGLDFMLCVLCSMFVGGRLSGAYDV